MSKVKVIFLLGLAVLVIGALLLRYATTHAPPVKSRGTKTITTASPIKKLQFAFHTFLQKHFPPLVNVSVSVSGPAGTPVVVGYRIDGTRGHVIQGVVPVHFSVRARRRLQVAVKNLGNYQSGFQVSYRAPSSGGSSGGGMAAQFYGFDADFSFGPMMSSTGGGGLLYPNDWPVTLPPGMSAQEAKSHDFKKDLSLLHLRNLLERFARDPEDLPTLVGIGYLNLSLTNRAAAEEAFQKVFNAECKDAEFLNGVVYNYVNASGTNLACAYESACKAQALLKYPAPHIQDTIAWVLVKRGDYNSALNLLSRNSLSSQPEVRFHLGMAHYMLLQEEPARKAFQSVVQVKYESREKIEARKCLRILDLKERSPKPKVVAMLKARLAEAPDDPVALDRLGGLFEPILANSKPTGDPLVLKALGLRAYRRGDYQSAANFLAESARQRTADADAFFYLGLAHNHLHQTNECADSLQKAKTLTLKDAQIEEADNVLASLSQN